MSAHVNLKRVTRHQAQILMEAAIADHLSDEDQQIIKKCLSPTSTIWSGFYDDQLVCVFGLVPPTLSSNNAYLWLYTVPEAVSEHAFYFIRHSQRAVEEMLKLYPRIVGHTKASEHKSIRWLKWIGAKYGPVDESGLRPFVIEKVANG